MKLAYRNQKNAELMARYWNKPLDKPDWYKIEASGGDQAEIIIYDVIGWPFNDARDLVIAISDLKGRPILGRINSPGGDAFDAVALFNAFKDHDAPVTMRIEALAASSASYLALSGSEVQAYPNTMMMIHEPWTISVGDQYRFRDVADVLGQISGIMIDMYAAASTIGKRKIKQMLKDETWMTAREMKDYGFIDTILDGQGAQAKFDLSIYSKAPNGFVSSGGGRKLTEREIERALRDAGASRTFAKAVAAGRSDSHQWDADHGMRNNITSIIEILKGKNYATG